MGMIENLEGLLAKGQDSAVLRFSLGNAYFSAGDFARAVVHFAVAVEQDPQYSAAWKLYGRSLAECGRFVEALEVFDKGVEVAEGRGDIQAVKEMRVFQKRAQKSLAGGG
jgi:Tfp pilus assembly protein PilF